MSRYTVHYSPDAAQARKTMSDSFRIRFDSAMQTTLAVDPYQHGSAALHGEADRREASVAGVVIRYYVSHAVPTITIVRVATSTSKTLRAGGTNLSRRAERPQQRRRGFLAFLRKSK